MTVAPPAARWARSARSTPALRARTYLTPGIPFGFFNAIVEAWSADVGPVALDCDERASGPRPGEPNPFRAGGLDVGFMCAPAYLALRRSAPRSPVELLGVAAVFDDPRTGGRPHYFADVIVDRSHPASSFADLRDTNLGYNDALSLSGLLALELHLAALGLDRSFFASLRQTGSHAASLAALATREIDVATIDSTMLRRGLVAGDAQLAGMKVVASLGPHPIQPIVVRNGLPTEHRRHLCRVLERLTTTAAGRAALAPFGCIGFAPVTDDDYAALDRDLERLAARRAQSSSTRR